MFANLFSMPGCSAASSRTNCPHCSAYQFGSHDNAAIAADDAAMELMNAAFHTLNAELSARSKVAATSMATAISRAAATEENGLNCIGTGGIASVVHNDSCCQVGVFSNEHVIKGLLYLVAQLALFGRPPPTTSRGTEPPSEAEQRLLGWKADSAEQATVGGVEIATQTGVGICNNTEDRQDRQARGTSAERKVGVRIGGGYHVIAHQQAADTAVQHAGKAAHQVHSHHSGRCCDGVTATQYCREELLHSSYDEHPFAHGAAPDAMKAKRFSVGTYTDTGNRGQLYRVLRPTTPHTYDSPPLSPQQRCSSSGSEEEAHVATRNSDAAVQPGRIRPGSAPGRGSKA